MSARRGRRSGRGAHDSGAHDASGMGRWLLTYSDMITLLLALFIILFAISVINGKKFEAFKMGLTQSFSNTVVHRNYSDSIIEQLNSPIKTIAPRTAQEEQSSAASQSQTTSSAAAQSTSGVAVTLVKLEQIAQDLERALAQAGLSQYTSVAVATQGVVVRMFADKAYFATDNATLQPIGDRVIDVIAGVLAPLPNHVEVQGYTDDEPIYGGPYVSNWELSAARAASAVVRLIAHDHLTPNRISAEGFGTTHPIASNTTPAGRAENRRVDIVVLTTNVPAPGTTSTGSSER